MIVKKFKEFTEHPDGTYMEVKVSKQTQKDLTDWSTKNNIPNVTDPKELHTTIVYSRKPVPELMKYKIQTPIKAKVKELKIFNTRDGKNCLVAAVDSDELHNHHNKIHKEYDASYDFPTYIPHVTVSYDFGDRELPKDVPDFPIVYDDYNVKPLDPLFKPGTKDE